MYGAGQDLPKEAFSGNMRGMGPAVAEIEFEKRSNEPFLFFAADKTDPGRYNYPLYMAFADSMNAPGERCDIAPRLHDPERYVVESVWSRSTGDQAVSVSTSRLHNIAGKHTGKDDPVMLVPNTVASKAIDMRRQGFFGAAMLPMTELEYTGITSKLESLDSRFRVREN